MGDFFSNLTPQRIIIFVVCVGILVFWIRFKWRRTTMSAFLKRKTKPKYLMFQLSPTEEITEEKIGGMNWYDMFEKSV